MVCKLIRCVVSPELQIAFSCAQEGWTDARLCPGFIGQCGGWEVRQPGHAWILSFWKTQEDLDHFMTQVHDRIQMANRQTGTYSAIQIWHAIWATHQPGSSIDLQYQLQLQQSYCRLRFLSQPTDIQPHRTFQFSINTPPPSILHVQLLENDAIAPLNGHPGVHIQLVNSWNILFLH